MDEMKYWEPAALHKEAQANALLNIARELHYCGAAIESLLYGLKYAKGDGMSLAEAVEVAGRAQADATESLATATEQLADAFSSGCTHGLNLAVEGVGQAIRDRG